MSDVDHTFLNSVSNLDHTVAPGNVQLELTRGLLGRTVDSWAGPRRQDCSLNGAMSTTMGDLRKKSPLGKHRFPIELDVRYQCLKGSQLFAVGLGKTIGISSQEIDFTTQHLLERGIRVLLAMEWPAVLHNTCMMKLEICGSVIRGDAGTAAITIARYDFWTRADGLSPLRLDSNRSWIFASNEVVVSKHTEHSWRRPQSLRGG